MSRLDDLDCQLLLQDSEVCLEVKRFAHVKRVWSQVSSGFSAYQRTRMLLSTVSIFANHTGNL
jgi:hypothetical protein